MQTFATKLQICKNEVAKVCKIATIVAIVRYKIALYNASKIVTIATNHCCKPCKIATKKLQICKIKTQSHLHFFSTNQYYGQP